jgi:predicted nucleotidyltransferase
VVDLNRALFESVVRLLVPVLDELVFVGGCTTGLFITDPAAGGVRPTKDVDAIVDVTSYAEYTTLSERLRTLGLAEDTTPGAPFCRWRHGQLIVDVMPTDATVLGFSNRWYPTAIETAQTFRIAGHDVRVVTPPLFIATKLEAFHGRGDDDVVASHDLDGRPEIVGDVAAASDDVRAYIGAEIRELLGNRDFTEALAGFLLPDPASQERRSLLEGRLRSLSIP